MIKSNFQKVIDFNRQFGVTVHDNPQPNILDEDPKLVKLRLSLIHEEVKELTDSIAEKNIIEVIDALTDILYVVYGAGASFGLDLDKAFDIVHNSNMSKSCETEQLALETVEWYKKNEPRYDSPSCHKIGDRWVVFNESTGKVLKSIAYIPADLKELIRN